MSSTETSAERRTFGTLRLRGRIWWVRYRIGGKETWESLRTTSEKEAVKKLAVLEDRIGRGEHVAPTVRRLGFAELERMLRDSYRAEGNRSLDRAEYALTHLREAFGTMRATAITTDRVRRYEADRLNAGASRATVNYELALLRRAFTLAGEVNPMLQQPSISTPDPRNARKGFFERADFERVAAQLPDELKPVMWFGYYTGWRVQSEVLPLTWDRVDFQQGVVRLDSSKNDEGRTFPFGILPDLAALLDAQREHTSAIERATGRIIPTVFHRNGKPIKSYKHGWKAALQRAAKGTERNGLSSIEHPELLGRLVHDLRRTAVRNLVRAGVSETTAMKLTGHKTREVFDRYDIVNEADLRAATAKLAIYHGQQGSEQTSKGTVGGQSPLQLVSSDK